MKKGWLFFALGRGCRRQSLHLDLEYAPVLHLENSVAAPLEFEAFAALRQPAEPPHHKSAKGFKTLVARQSNVQMGFQIANVRSTLEDQSPCLEKSWLYGDIELVFDLSHKLLQGIFHGDQSHSGTIFVDDDGQMPLALAKFIKQI